jgi:hypothetical protein
MSGKRTPGYHDHSIGNLGCEPRPGSGLHILRWRLTVPLGMWASRALDLSMSSSRSGLM